MNGIILTNKFRKNNNIDPSISYEMELECISEYVSMNKINLVTLNPHQINHYYTIPEALLYDLKKTNRKIDCLVMFSMETVYRFSFIFPEYWDQMRAYFTQVRCVSSASKANSLNGLVTTEIYPRIDKVN